MKPLQLTPLEIASGLVLGTDDSAPHLPRRVEKTPHGCLEEAILPWLARPPCYVCFSGGRDSSGILAVATGVARHHGLPDPIPITMRFPESPDTHEDGWQRLVIDHLRIKEWETHEVTGELDYLGPFAQEIIRDLGIVWPANTHPLLFLARAVSQGALITGLDGDAIFGEWRWQSIGVGLRRRVNGRDIARFSYAQAPSAVKLRRSLRNSGVSRPWLTESALSCVREQEARDDAAEPGRWRARVDWYSRRRYLTLMKQAIASVSGHTSIPIVSPFMNDRFLASLSRVHPLLGLDRTGWMHYLFDDLLPKAVIERPTKGIFTNPYWGALTQRFAESWDGNHVDEDLVKVETLKQIWSSKSPDTRTAPLLQSIWLRAGERV